MDPEAPATVSPMTVGGLAAHADIAELRAKVEELSSSAVSAETQLAEFRLDPYALLDALIDASMSVPIDDVTPGAWRIRRAVCGAVGIVGPVEDSAVSEEALRRPSVAYAVYRSVASGAVPLLLPRWRGNAARSVRLDIRDREVCDVVRTDVAWVGRLGPEVSADMPMEEARAWCDARLQARGYREVG